MKRLFDFIVSSIALLILLPVFAVIGILIKLDSKGPVFYLQNRIGKGGKPFQLYKFRSMVTDADKIRRITVGNRDPRITKSGYLLRKFKVDELPQLINVWKGEMSFVGPRPELIYYVNLYNEEQRKVLSVKPGITDYASIKFRNENELLEGQSDPEAYYIDCIMPQKLALNNRYIAQQNIFLDIKIIFKTLFSIFR
jgi:lipopolysaccharide/colanic/teichoic acid biosynthesis glycosyltransferase